MPKQVKATFTPPDRETVTCPYCGHVIHARWVTETEVQIISPVCSHYVGHDRASFWFDDPITPPFPWWDPDRWH